MTTHDSQSKEVTTDNLLTKLSAWSRVFKACKDKAYSYYDRVSYITLHYLYFITTCLLASLVFWGSSSAEFEVRYIDSLYMAVSAMTTAGLNTVNVSQLNTWQQVILFLLFIMGSTILMSCAVLHIRKAAFKRRLQELADHRQRKLSRRRTWIKRIGNSLSPTLPNAAWRGGSRREGDANIQELAGINAPHDGSLPPQRVDTDDSTQTVYSALSDDPLGLELRRGTPSQDHDDPSALKSPKSTTRVAFASDVKLPPSAAPGPESRVRNPLWSNKGIGAHSAVSHPMHASPPDQTDFADTSLLHEQHTSRLYKYLDTFNGYVGRNSQFHQLTEEERRKLGGIEYDALCLLSWIVPIYLVLFQLIGALGCGAWVLLNRPEIARENGVGPFWTGVFWAVSAFNNSGMSLLDANAAALQTSYYMLITLGFLSLAGNTYFPIFLRLILWTLKHCCSSSRWDHWRCVLGYILDHPRRVYTDLFPSQATWWLALVLIGIDGTDWLVFMVLNLKNSTLSKIEPKFRVFDGLFQAIAVRGSGFYVVSLSALSPGTLMLYASMMYLSAYPITMSIRSTNVYEERSLGVFSDDAPAPAPESTEPEPKPTLNRVQTTLKLVRRMTLSQGTGVKTASGANGSAAGQSGQQATWNGKDFLRLQLRSQLGHDLWWLVAAVFLIIVIENDSLTRDPVNFSIFNFLFEVVSAYGPVGLSIGVPWAAYSFSGEWHTLSKLILCAVMLRGRHRGLPVAIDRAILLPHESLDWAEEADGQLKRNRNAFASAMSARNTPATTPAVTPRIDESQVRRRGTLPV